MISKMSPLTLGLLALLAYRTYQGKGRLADMLGRGEPDAAAGSQPGAQGGGGLSDILGNIFGGSSGTRPAVPGGQAPQGGGGLGDILGNVLGGNNANTRPMAPAGQSGGGQSNGGLGGLLGGLLGGAAAGGILSGGLGGLLEQFQKQGQADTANSWVGKGENRPLSSDELERAVGKDTLDELARNSGRPYDDVVRQLTSELPDAVDELTPDGRVPTEDEARRLV